MHPTALRASSGYLRYCIPCVPRASNRRHRLLVTRARSSIQRHLSTAQLTGDEEPANVTLCATLRYKSSTETGEPSRSTLCCVFYLPHSAPRSHRHAVQARFRRCPRRCCRCCERRSHRLPCRPGTGPRFCHTEQPAHIFDL